METTLDIKKKIHEFIDHADERILRIISAIITSEKNYEPLEPTVPEYFYEELDKEREKHINGETPSYSWEEVKARLTKTHEL